MDILYPISPISVRFLMETLSLSVATRTMDASAALLRREGQIPGVIYGNTQNTLISVEEVALKRAYIKAGESTLVHLTFDGNTLPVLFHALQFDPVSDRFTHVDFFAVNMKEEVEADVQIRLEGESPAVKELGAILVTPLDTVTVRALPANLPHDLVVHLTELTEFDGTLTVADIVVPEGVTILNEPTDVLVIAQEPRAEEVVEAPVAAEGIEGVAAEGAAPAEGATPAEGAPAAKGGKKE